MIKFSCTSDLIAVIGDLGHSQALPCQEQFASGKLEASVYCIARRRTVPSCWPLEVWLLQTIVFIGGAFLLSLMQGSVLQVLAAKSRSDVLDKCKMGTFPLERLRRLSFGPRFSGGRYPPAFSDTGFEAWEDALGLLYL
jgi:hypothetical protein